MTAPLRLMAFDRTCVSYGVGLSTAWGTGSLLYRALGRLDGARGVTTWAEALRWIATFAPDRPIGEVQYWGHGRWGRAYVGGDRLDASAFGPSHPLRRDLDAIRERLLPDGRSLVWLRTCEVFGARAGHDFATRLADCLAARVAGHTHIIGLLQSGLHGLRPGHVPDWSAAEGIAVGTPEAPERACHSLPTSPHTITCFTGAVPEDWFA